MSTRRGDESGSGLRGGAALGRRALLGGAIALGAAAALNAAARTGAAAPPPKEAGLSYEGLLKGQAGFQPRKPMAPPHAELPGFLSRLQLAQSYTHYAHDFQRLLVAERALAALPRDKAHRNDYAALRLQQVEAANSVLLYEFYFRGMAPRPVKPPAYVIDNINEHMGSMESWREDFIACARVASAWAILAYDPYDDRWHNVPTGKGDAGGWVGANPLVVCAMAESAYAADYPMRDSYVERFIEHIDWNVVAARYRAVDRH
ncbi:MAG TPA: Fe-Mn family superoxide dismutase [Candidatus Binataceae bacterium]|nr:Fe-Mn family superoxide dismutase [Candidatus Binataceae bacterium]